jgi:hypothetical protein
MAVALVAILLLGAEAVIFSRVMHTGQEEAAYKYSEMKSARDASRSRCETHASNLAALKIWAEQNGIKPPADYLVTKDCVILSTSEIQKEQSK